MMQLLFLYYVVKLQALFYKTAWQNPPSWCSTFASPEILCQFHHLTASIDRYVDNYGIDLSMIRLAVVLLFQMYP
jgi:hypothetical protein